MARYQAARVYLLCFCGKRFHLLRSEFKRRHPPVCCSHTCAKALARSRRAPLDCAVCGKRFHVIPSQAKWAKCCSAVCRNVWKSRIQSGAGNPAWKGGRRVDPRTGYVYVHVGTNRAGRYKYRLEHRVVMEEHLGRPLLRSELVHHKNGVKGDNRLENLEIMEAGDHARLHATGRCRPPFVKLSWARGFDRCVICGTSERPHKGRGRCTLCADQVRRRDWKAAYQRKRDRCAEFHRCEFCGARYQAAKISQRFCSKSCTGKAKRK